MACDIHGWIEINPHASKVDEDGPYAWQSAVHLDPILSRAYTVFGRLSHDGSRQGPGDVALFAGRGLPDKENLGTVTRREYEDGWGDESHHRTHFTHGELTQTKVRVNVKEGETKAIKPIEYLREGIEEYNPEKENARQVSEAYNNRMKYGRIKRAWESAFTISEGLAERCGHEQVRWVIWFDN